MQQNRELRGKLCPVALDLSPIVASVVAWRTEGDDVKFLAIISEEFASSRDSHHSGWRGI